MTPYSSLSAEKFWRTGVSEKNVFSFENFWKSKWKLPQDARFSTYGSCFAQHISRELKAREMAWVNTEPAPARTPQFLQDKYNYGVFSSRTANIYTVRQLKTWVEMAIDPSGCEKIECVAHEGRFYDSLRPNIEPSGFQSADEMHAALETTAGMFKKSILESDVFIFTLGLTEGWENSETGQIYPICPGTIVGSFDPGLHVFKNYTYPEIRADMIDCCDMMRNLNPEIKVILTVSPVPLTATASPQHVLLATTYSKSTLRCVAGDLASELDIIDYFPSYEVITGQPTRSIFYESNLRSVALAGVDVVMKYFFDGLDLSGQPTGHGDALPSDLEELLKIAAAQDLVCEEELLERSNES